MTSSLDISWSSVEISPIFIVALSAAISFSGLLLQFLVHQLTFIWLIDYLKPLSHVTYCVAPWTTGFSVRSRRHTQEHISIQPEETTVWAECFTVVPHSTEKWWAWGWDWERETPSRSKLYAEWVGDETQLYVGDTTHTHTHTNKMKDRHISSSLTGETSCRTKGRRMCLQPRLKWWWVNRVKERSGDMQRSQLDGSVTRCGWTAPCTHTRTHTHIQCTLPNNHRHRQKYGKHSRHLSQWALCVYESIIRPVSSA